MEQGNDVEQAGFGGRGCCRKLHERAGAFRSVVSLFVLTHLWLNSPSSGEMVEYQIGTWHICRPCFFSRR